MMLGVVISLLWCLVEVNSQTFPYVSFLGQTLANHSYVDFSLVGLLSNGSDSVQCHTDLTTCCSQKVRVPIVVTGTSLMEPDYHLVLQLFMRVVERRELTCVFGSVTPPTGMYHCDIATIDNEATQPTRKRVYVGLYANHGGLC